MSLILLLLLGVARADGNPTAEAVARARAAVLAGDPTTANRELALAEAAAPTNPAVVLSTDLARIDFYRGVLEWTAGERDAALGHWRRSATLNLRFQPEADVLPDVEGQDAYYALQGEVRGYPTVELGIPQDTTAVVFVDGTRPEADGEVPEGRHYIQVRCDDGTLHGGWMVLPPVPDDWLAVCDGRSWSSSARSLSDRSERSGAAGEVIGWSMVGTGAALVGAGTAWNFAFTNPAWEAGVAARDNAGSVSRTEADGLVADFNRNRWITVGLFAAGVAVVTPGILLGPVELKPALTLDGATIRGAF